MMQCSVFQRLLVAIIAAIAVPMVAQAAALFTIGPDANPFFPVPRVLNQLPATSPVSAAPLATLGDGTVGFNGGLAYNSGNSLLYAIGNDSFGNSALYSMTTLGGGLTSVGGLGQGFNGGLAYDSASGDFYAIANDFFANSTLYKVTPAGVATPLGMVGFGFYGGLTYDADDGKLYAIAGDLFGVMRSVVAIDISTVAANPLFNLGDGSIGFNGGLAYDDVADLFYAIGNDFSATSSLFSFALGGGAASLAPIGSPFGQGFLNIGLALAPEVTPPPPPTVPEPPAVALIMLGALLALAANRFRLRRPRTHHSARSNTI
jgi:hypothetical protein